MEYTLKQLVNGTEKVVPFEIPEEKGKYKMKVHLSNGDVIDTEEFRVNNVSHSYDFNLGLSDTRILTAKFRTPKVSNGGILPPDSIENMTLSEIQELKNKIGCEGFANCIGQIVNTANGKQYRLVGYGIDETVSGDKNTLTFIAIDSVGTLALNKICSPSTDGGYWVHTDSIYNVDIGSDNNLVQTVKKTVYYCSANNSGTLSSLKASTRWIRELNFFIAAPEEIGLGVITGIDPVEQYQYFVSAEERKLGKTWWTRRCGGYDYSGIGVKGYLACYVGTSGTMSSTAKGTGVTSPAYDIFPMFCI